MEVVTYPRSPKTRNLFLMKSSWFRTVESKTKSRKRIFPLPRFQFPFSGREREKNKCPPDGQREKGDYTRLPFAALAFVFEEGIVTRSDSHVFGSVKAGKYPIPRLRETLVEFEEADPLPFPVWKIFQNMRHTTWLVKGMVWNLEKINFSLFLFYTFTSTQVLGKIGCWKINDVVFAWNLF